MVASAAVNFENQNSRYPKLLLHLTPFSWRNSWGSENSGLSKLVNKQWKSQDANPDPSDSGVLVLRPPHRAVQMFACEAFKFRSLR